MFKRMYPLFDESGEIGAASTSEGVVDEGKTADPQTETGTEPDDSDKIEKSKTFAKRLEERTQSKLSEERAKWEQETAEKYKDYDLHKELSEYLSELNGGMDLMTLKERREMERLQERAENNNISPEMQKRLEYLEGRDKQAQELEQKQQEEQRVNTYFDTLNEFVKDKGVDAAMLNQFMIDNDLMYNPASPEKSLNVALKAMKSEENEKKLLTAKEDSIKEYLASKSAPRVEGGNGAIATQSVDTSKMSWKELQKHTLSRLEAAKTAQ